MATTLVQIRVDKDLKDYTSKIFEDLGIDMPTAFRIFLKKCLTVNGLPFEMRNESPIISEGKKAFYQLREEARKNNLQDMTLEDINNEIVLYRKGK